jgi:hypothetical protein
MHKNLSHVHPQNFQHYLEAGMEHTSNRRLRELAEHGHPKIRARVAENAKSSAMLLDKLSDDPNSDVRIAVAQNAASTPSIRMRLIEDEDPNVRYAIADDANVPLDILYMLLEDEHPYVSHRAHKTIEKIKAAQRALKGKKDSPKERLLKWRLGNMSASA